MQDMLTSLSTYGYIILFVYTLGGGMVALIAAGILSHLGKMDLGVSIAIAAFSNALGDMLLFYLGRYNKDMIRPYIKNHKRKFAYSCMLMKKQGDKLLFIKKYIYGLKTLIPIAIGFTPSYSVQKFVVINIFASIVWALVVGISAYYIGSTFEQISEFLGENSWIMPVFMMSLIGGIYYFLHIATRKKTKGKI
ncbi:MULTISPECIES: DedA family protein [unclassified Campylobacter]|uniref:DedA family protein n=1 Tax=unclassified Campylobacter TaxID=2593542 RepID=UPI003D327A14